jgi:uncharacterized repeat protein (TIGR02543 family)
MILNKILENQNSFIRKIFLLLIVLLMTTFLIGCDSKSSFEKDDTDYEVEYMVASGSKTSSKTYKLTFNANGGKVSTKNKKIEKNQKCGKLPVPTRSGYAFVGWYTKKSGGTLVDSNTVMKKSITVYAHWKKGNIAVKSVSLDKKKMEINVGETGSLVAKVNPVNATNKKLTWTSSDKSIATVDSNGVVTGKKAGTVTITVKSNNNKKATCKVIVKTASTSYDITKDKKVDYRMKKLFGNVEEASSCYSDTLNYRVLKSKDKKYGKYQYVALVWVKNPYKQINSALASYKKPLKFRSASDILTNEKNKFFKNKDGCMIATNGSDVPSYQEEYPNVLISKGKVFTGANEYGVLSNRLVVSRNGELQVMDYVQPKQFISKGVLNTWDASYRVTYKKENGVYKLKLADYADSEFDDTLSCSTSKYALNPCRSTTWIGQSETDKHNFILLSTYGSMESIPYGYEVSGGYIKTYALLGRERQVKLFTHNPGGPIKLINSDEKGYASIWGNPKLADMLYFSQHVPTW